MRGRDALATKERLNKKADHMDQKPSSSIWSISLYIHFPTRVHPRPQMEKFGNNAVIMSGT